MALFTRVVSTSPVPDWQRQRAQIPSSPLIFHQPFEAPYQPLSGAKPETATSAWAKQAVQTLTANRWRLSRPYAIEQKRAGVPAIPKWAWVAAGLPEFSFDSYQDWSSAMIAMILDQLPAFDLHPDWRSIRQQNQSRASRRHEILATISAELPGLARIVSAAQLDR
jgi:hypothetical protein